jgi:hypothetical protein
MALRARALPLVSAQRGKIDSEKPFWKNRLNAEIGCFDMIVVQ